MLLPVLAVLILLRLPILLGLLRGLLRLILLLLATLLRLFLLLLTAMGPLLAWRSTSWDSVKRNFTWPAVGAVLTAIVLVAIGWHPWKEVSILYSVMAVSLSVLVLLTVGSEFVRGARVIRGHTGQNLLAAMVTLTGRNTRRYGGYIVHIGVVIIVIGFAGAAFNRDIEHELGFGDKMSLGPYDLVCRSYTQDSNRNYNSESAIIDVFKNGKQVDTLYPERRTYLASGQTATMVANRSTLKEDLYLVYAGRNDETGQPIIKAHLNPLVMWIWLGVHVMIIGTIVALVPNRAPAAVREPSRVRAAAVEVGD